METAIEHVTRTVETNESSMWEFLEDVINLDSPSFEKELTDGLGAKFATQAEAFGFTVDYDRQDRFGDNIVARYGADGSEPKRGGILLVGHMDTVFGPGTASERPFRRDKERAYGPGVLDMKTGLVIGLWAVGAAVDASDEWNTPLTFIFNTDEEPGSPNSRDVILAEAPAHSLAFILEPGTGTDQPKLTVSRKGVAIFQVNTVGVAAHAGVEPEKGANSIVDIAERILAMSAVADPAVGTSVTTGVVHGGTHPYVVPAECSLEIDVRVPTMGERERVLAEFDQISNEKYVEGTTSVLSGGFHRPPMVPSADSEKLADELVTLSKEIGYPLGIGGSGGASDGNLTSGAGIPTVDGMGAHGGNAHSPDEYIFTDSLSMKCQLLARFLHRWNSGAFQL